LITAFDPESDSTSVLSLAPTSIVGEQGLFESTTEGRSLAEPGTATIDSSRLDEFGGVVEGYDTVASDADAVDVAGAVGVDDVDDVVEPTPQLDFLRKRAGRPHFFFKAPLSIGPKDDDDAFLCCCCIVGCINLISCPIVKGSERTSTATKQKKKKKKKKKMRLKIPPSPSPKPLFSIAFHLLTQFRQ
jgi:hypothetical protein